MKRLSDCSDKQEKSNHESEVENMCLHFGKGLTGQLRPSDGIAMNKRGNNVQGWVHVRVKAKRVKRRRERAERERLSRLKMLTRQG